MAHTYASRNFSLEVYIRSRPKYPPELFESILAAHDALDGSEREVALDVGCGPGIAAKPLVPQFKTVVGVDPGENMIAAAKVYEPEAEFHLGSAEDLSMVKDHSVDLVVAAQAAHFFEPRWWEEASRVLKPVGSVAIFCYGGVSRPLGTPGAEAFRPLRETFRHSIGHSVPSTEIARDMYDNLPLPEPSTNIKLVKRQHWNREGLVDQTEAGGRGRFVLPRRMTVRELREHATTMAPVHRWQAANPDLIRTKDDPVERTMSEIKEKMRVEEDTPIDIGHPLTVLIFAKTISR